MEKTDIKNIVANSPCLSEDCLRKLALHTKEVLSRKSEHEDLRNQEHRLGWYDCDANRCELRSRIYWPNNKMNQVTEELGKYIPSHMLKVDNQYQYTTAYGIVIKLTK